MTDWECKVDRIASSDHNYVAKQAGEKYSRRKKFLAAAFLIGEDKRQYGWMMTQLSNNYTKGQQSYILTVQKAQALLTA